MFDLETFVLLAIVLSLGAFVQAASGFAAGLLIVSVLVWIGYGIPEAQVALLIATLPQNIWGVWSFRDAIEPRALTWPAVGRLTFLPIGIGTLKQMENLPLETMKQVVGAVMLLITFSIIFLRPVPRQRLHPLWSWLAFPASGFLQGLVGMGGPAMVLWVQAHDWDTRRTRGFLFAMYLVSLFPAFAMVGYAFGDRIVGPAIMALFLTPLLIPITTWGLRTGTWLGQKRLRRLTLALLVLMGVMSVLAPLLSRG
jgi:uncharacterized protein